MPGSASWSAGSSGAPKGHAAFCDADRWFYDAPYRRDGESFRQALAPVPAGWISHRSGDWLALQPLGLQLPAQGWKIHVSAGLDNAQAVLDEVHAYCVERRIAFTFVPSRYLLHLRNAKYADRSASGKFLTPSTPPTPRPAGASPRTWTRCRPASPARTSSAICAGTTALGTHAELDLADRPDQSAG
ncbi:hypothetical protein ACIGFK_42350 [Streptomyces sp. NPDC085524]|uniref:class III lanthionine synthetase LanKC N-terminal domain-containing protein n=1 Tax=unclassified Streptomyces TaxID=2593676 RepID=UPI0036C2F268